ncbi:MAG: mechanosensitive ion channel [Candidatus Eremiobacteraeota bacterium]|nr:mechanosensitive ion channel [Candidatus Eremiobacteraeota bacterium]MCW5866280.1 mechanosensitive ion channel [Candidatus Eremiobacteraeota bacterium]
MNSATRLLLQALVPLLVLDLSFIVFSSRLRARIEPRLQDLRLQKVTLLSGSWLRSCLRGCFRVVHWTLRLTLLSVALTLLGTQYPETDQIARQALEWLKTRLLSVLLSCWNYLPNLLTILVTLLLTRGVLKLNQLLFSAVERGDVTLPGFSRHWAQPTRQIVLALTLLVTFSIILPLLPGAASPVFRGASFLVGVLLSLGSGQAMTNLISGLSLTYSNAFHIQDVVKIGEFTGVVMERTLLVTRIRNFKNEEITIPNQTVMRGNVVNYSSSAREGGLLFHIGITLGYEVPAQRVVDVLLQAASQPGEEGGWLLQPAPFVLHERLEGSWVLYELNVAVNRPERMLDIYSALRRRILDCCHEAGIEMVTPNIYALREALKD